MDIGFYKRARGIKHKTSMPSYPRQPTAAAPTTLAQAGSKAKTAAAPWAPVPAPPSAVVAVDSSGGPGGGDADVDVDRRAAMYISRVQERLRRERMTEDWRKYYGSQLPADATVHIS